MGGVNGESLSVRIVRSLADARGEDPIDTGFRLGRVVDTDALDAMAEHDGEPWELRFEVDGHAVEVGPDESVTIDGDEYR